MSKKTAWTSEIDALLGTVSDREAAKQIGCSGASVLRRRRELDISPFQSAAEPLKWTREMDALLGTMSDQEVASQFDCNGVTVLNRRRKLGIISWQEQNRIIPQGVSGFSGEAALIYATRRRHKKLELENALTYEQWNFACDWFEDCCAYCGTQTFLTEDHLVPISKGGPRVVLNIIPCCSSCNNSKHAKQAHLWIYEHFGMKYGKEIVERIVVYLTEVRSRWPSSS